jgi:hypothetical protein
MLNRSSNGRSDPVRLIRLAGHLGLFNEICIHGSYTFIYIISIVSLLFPELLCGMKGV